ncbi:hypothetical protein GCM10007053_01400 [Halioglobus pacificus]|uniref:Uncharacterized protein n=1 Tax=Parahalioglobus pacificus TaxID=930806 RepID=A0A918XCL9_9GAMM|nr:hypothetical protein GCM10007053_01400 [Halioglobus pacificus]
MHAYENIRHDLHALVPIKKIECSFTKGRLGVAGYKDGMPGGLGMAFPLKLAVVRIEHVEATFSRRRGLACFLAEIVNALPGIPI